MVSSPTFQFLKSLHKNNNRDWFLANKNKYDFAKSEYLSFVEEVLNGILKC